MLFICLFTFTPLSLLTFFSSAYLSLSLSHTHRSIPSSRFSLYICLWFTFPSQCLLSVFICLFVSFLFLGGFVRVYIFFLFTYLYFSNFFCLWLFNLIAHSLLSSSVHMLAHSVNERERMEPSDFIHCRQYGKAPSSLTRNTARWDGKIIHIESQLVSAQGKTRCLPWPGARRGKVSLCVGRSMFAPINLIRVLKSSQYKPPSKQWKNI